MCRVYHSLGHSDSSRVPMKVDVSLVEKEPETESDGKSVSSSSADEETPYCLCLESQPGGIL